MFTSPVTLTPITKLTTPKEALIIVALFVFSLFLVPNVALGNEQIPNKDIILKTASYFSKRINGGGRYMEKNCDPPRFDFPNYAGFPVQECAYENLGLSARVVMLNAPAEKLASWTVSACTKFSANKIEACSLQVAKRIWEQSNGQFVVAGIVIEEASVIGGTSNEGMNFEFRDGVTVKSVLELNGSSRQLTDRELEGSLVATVLNTKVYARPAGTTREQYVAAGGSIEVGKSDPHSARNLQWLEAVRAEYKTAWTTDNNLLIDAWVKDYFK